MLGQRRIFYLRVPVLFNIHGVCVVQVIAMKWRFLISNSTPRDVKYRPSLDRGEK